VNAYSSRARPPSWTRRRTAALPRLAGGCLVGLTLALVAGCGPVRLQATTNIPTPLIVKIPIGVALFIPKEFSQYVHHEERWSTAYEIDLGHAQAEGITRLMTAMFERVVAVDSLNMAGRLDDGGVQAILEPSIEEYAFVTPRDAGGAPFFAVSIKYRVNVYLPDGKLADSWGFTGYGTSPSRGFASETPLAAATALAMRDAGAKLAVEFREQAVLRGLLPQPTSADSQEVDPQEADPQEAGPQGSAAQGASAGGIADPQSQAPGSGPIQDPQSQDPQFQDPQSQDGQSEDSPARAQESDGEDAGAEVPFGKPSEETARDPGEVSEPNPNPSPDPQPSAERPPIDDTSEVPGSEG